MKRNGLIGQLLIFMMMVFMTIYVLPYFVKQTEEIRAEQLQIEYDYMVEQCDFHVSLNKYGTPECRRPCASHNTDGKNCVLKGCYSTGFLSRECDMYVCDDGTELIPQCAAWFGGSKEEWCSNRPEDVWWCD